MWIPLHYVMTSFPLHHHIILHHDVISITLCYDGISLWIPLHYVMTPFPLHCNVISITVCNDMSISYVLTSFHYTTLFLLHYIMMPPPIHYITSVRLCPDDISTTLHNDVTSVTLYHFCYITLWCYFHYVMLHCHVSPSHYIFVSFPLHHIIMSFLLWHNFHYNLCYTMYVESEIL